MNPPIDNSIDHLQQQPPQQFVHYPPKYVSQSSYENNRIPPPCYEMNQFQPMSAVTEQPSKYSIYF